MQSDGRLSCVDCRRVRRRVCQSIDVVREGVYGDETTSTRFSKQILGTSLHESMDRGNANPPQTRKTVPRRKDLPHSGHLIYICTTLLTHNAHNLPSPLLNYTLCSPEFCQEATKSTFLLSRRFTSNPFCVLNHLFKVTHSLSLSTRLNSKYLIN